MLGTRFQAMTQVYSLLFYDRPALRPVLRWFPVNMIDEAMSVHDMHLCHVVCFRYPVVEQFISEVGYFHDCPPYGILQLGLADANKFSLETSLQVPLQPPRFQRIALCNIAGLKPLRKPADPLLTPAMGEALGYNCSLAPALQCVVANL